MPASASGGRTQPVRSTIALTSIVANRRDRISQLEPRGLRGHGARITTPRGQLRRRAVRGVSLENRADEPCSATKQRATGGDLERPASEQAAADHATHEPQRRSASEHPADRDREIDELAS
jgi:hypothetical protein